MVWRVQPIEEVRVNQPVGRVDPVAPSDRVAEIVPALTPPQVAALRDYLVRTAADVTNIRTQVDKDILAGQMRFLARLLDENLGERQRRAKGQGGATARPAASTVKPAPRPPTPPSPPLEIA